MIQNTKCRCLAPHDLVCLVEATRVASAGDAGWGRCRALSGSEPVVLSHVGAVGTAVAAVAVMVAVHFSKFRWFVVGRSVGDLLD